jgi:squalene-hopene/tetraprenyl-beta-curcumene cyclase
VNRPLRQPKWPFTNGVAIAFGLALAGPAASGLAQPPQVPATARRVEPATKGPDEPIAAAASMAQAARFLDEMAVNWTRERKCGSCHSNYAYLVACPSLKETSGSAMAEVRRFFEQRVEHWNDDDAAAKPRWDAEVIATAASLALNDDATSHTLHPLTRRALDRVWTLQKPGGGFDWLKCNWPPLEHDDYYGAVVAAVGAGHAPDNYAKSPAAEAGLKKLRAYFASTPAPDLHHQVMLLWASTRLDGFLTATEQAATFDRLRKLQRDDGGWNLPSLGAWKRRDGTSNDADAASDGYATGLVVYVMRQAGVPAADPAVERGVRWLLSHQRVSGRWFTRSLNNDKEHYISRVGTAYAVLALKSCNAMDQ